MRLAALIVRNYKRVGPTECAIRIDDIVVLIGPNNSGKSTILDAYEAFASGGKELDRSVFHNEDSSDPVEIVGVFGAITDDDLDTIGKKWKHLDAEYGECIKVRWRWLKPGEKGQKESFDPDTASFVAGGVGGWDSLIQSRIPQPVRIRPTDSVETTQTKIVGMLKDHVKSQLKADATRAKAAFEQIEKLAQELFEESKSAIEELSDKITSSVAQIFPGTSIALVPRSKDALDEKLIAAESYLKVGTTDGGNTPLSLQGTGLQRTLLWSALAVMTDGAGGKKKAKPSADVGRILLVDEPEAFLHPPTIRSAREALYNFALTNPDWQVLATTHSPIFIDLSKDHTTIVRVDTTSAKQRYVSTDKVSFDADERTRLQMVRSCNPIVNEFFFFDKVVLVEGSTEAIAVRHVAQVCGEDVHVIDCVGKANVPLFARILNQFQLSYIVIHDSDAPKCMRKGKVVANGMWSLNEKIREVAQAGSQPYAFVQFPNFEGEFVGIEIDTGKVDNLLELLSDTSTDEYKRLQSTYIAVLKREPTHQILTTEAFEKKRAQYLSDAGLASDWRWS